MDECYHGYAPGKCADCHPVEYEANKMNHTTTADKGELPGAKEPRFTFSKEWCLRMAELDEGDECGAGVETLPSPLHLQVAAIAVKYCHCKNPESTTLDERYDITKFDCVEDVLSFAQELVRTFGRPADKGEQEFKREGRYFVFKFSDVEHLSIEHQGWLREIAGALAEIRDHAGKQPLECVVIESDWPEYEPVWKMIEDRMVGCNPNEGQHGLINDALYLVQAFENDCVATDYWRDIEEFRNKAARHLSSKQADSAERNFCPTCGKRLNTNDVSEVHTCSPPTADHIGEANKMVKADAVKMPEPAISNLPDLENENWRGYTEDQLQAYATAHTAEAVRELVEGLQHAVDWINSEPHGDNCFLGDELSGNRCWCGKDSFVEATDALLAKYAPSQEGGNRG